MGGVLKLTISQDVQPRLLAVPVLVSVRPLGRAQVNSIMKGGYDHYMQKEIHEQPESLLQTMRGRVKLLDTTPKASCPAVNQHPACMHVDASAGCAQLCAVGEEQRSTCSCAAAALQDSTVLPCGPNGGRSHSSGRWHSPSMWPIWRSQFSLLMSLWLRLCNGRCNGSKGHHLAGMDLSRG